ncbi:hypothetical protein B7W85_13225 [Allorhizobium ampelinum]|nr:hypothetical protein B7W85_13225 [Allorhizobium ampelinum]
MISSHTISKIIRWWRKRHTQSPKVKLMKADPVYAVLAYQEHKAKQRKKSSKVFAEAKRDRVTQLLKGNV